MGLLAIRRKAQLQFARNKFWSNIDICCCEYILLTFFAFVAIVARIVCKSKKWYMSNIETILKLKCQIHLQKKGAWIVDSQLRFRWRWSSIRFCFCLQLFSDSSFDFLIFWFQRMLQRHRMIHKQPTTTFRSQSKTKREK